MSKIKQFWLDSYRSDQTAFYFELVSFIFTVAASLTLAINANDPNMLYVYPGFFIGSITQAFASYRRGAAWVFLLTVYFSCVNVFGFIVALYG